MKTKDKKQSSELSGLIILGTLVFIVLGLPIGNFLLGLRFSLTYLLLIYLPFLSLVDRMNMGTAEKFLLSNVFGLSFAIIYVLLDVFLKIPLTKTIFIITTVIIYSTWFKRGS